MPRVKTDAAATQKRLAISGFKYGDLLNSINQETEKWALGQGKTSMCCLGTAEECEHRQIAKKLAASPFILGKRVFSQNRLSPSKRGSSFEFRLLDGARSSSTFNPAEFSGGQSFIAFYPAKMSPEFYKRCAELASESKYRHFRCKPSIHDEIRKVLNVNRRLRMRQPLQSCYRPSQDFSYSELSSPSLRSFNSLSLVSQTQSEERLWLPDEKTSRFVQKLHQTEEALGGKHLAYTNEKKTSQFVYQLLDHICKEYNKRNTKASMFIEMEGAITLFDERIVPDLLVMQRDF